MRILPALMKWARWFCVALFDTASAQRFSGLPATRRPGLLPEVRDIALWTLAASLHDARSSGTGCRCLHHFQEQRITETGVSSSANLLSNNKISWRIWNLQVWPTTRIQEYRLMQLASRSSTSSHVNYRAPLPKAWAQWANDWWMATAAHVRHKEWCDSQNTSKLIANWCAHDC